MIFVSRLMLFILFLSIFNVIKETFNFYMCFKQQKTYNIGNTRRLALWFSMSYILTVIFTGL